MIEKRPRRVREVEERCTDLVQVPVSPTLRAHLVEEARRAGYSSLAAFIREQRLMLDAPTPAA